MLYFFNYLILKYIYFLWQPTKILLDEQAIQ